MGFLGWQRGIRVCHVTYDSNSPTRRRRRLFSGSGAESTSEKLGLTAEGKRDILCIYRVSSVAFYLNTDTAIWIRSIRKYCYRWLVESYPKSKRMLRASSEEET